MDPLLRTALDAAEAAAAIHRKYAGRALLETATDKGTSDFVSAVDLEAQDAALSLISARFPGHRILAEEQNPTGHVASGEATTGTRSDGNGEPIWIVDPLDGTTNYLHGHPQYAASVAVAQNGEVLAGAVVAAATGERWWARKDGGSWKGGTPVRVSRLRTLRRALVGTGFPFKALDVLPDYLRQFERVLRSTAGIRRGGSAALDLCSLASGATDAFWELHLSPWDVAAGIVILTEAGGVITRVDGSPVEVEAAGTILAANSAELLYALGALVGGESPD